MKFDLGPVVKKISFELCQPLFRKSKIIFAILVKGIMSNNYFKFGPVVQEKTSFEDISYLELWRPLY